MRARNRDNARRTRKRKKLYIAFLNKALEALENVLNPREPEAVKTENNVDIGSSSSSVDVPADDGGEDDDNSSPSVILANRLQTMRSFLSLNHKPALATINIFFLLTKLISLSIITIVIISFQYSIYGCIIDLYNAMLIMRKVQKKKGKKKKNKQTNKKSE